MGTIGLCRDIEKCCKNEINFHYEEAFIKIEPKFSALFLNKGNESREDAHSKNKSQQKNDFS